MCSVISVRFIMSKSIIYKPKLVNIVTEWVINLFLELSASIIKFSLITR